MRNTTKLALMTAVLLAGCAKDGGIFTSSLPDETRVVDGPSLALPPQYDLRPPREAKDFDAQLRAQNELNAAQSMITGVSPTAAISADGAVSATSGGGDDQWLVDKAAQQSGVVADPNVRQELDAQAAAEQKKKADDNHKGALDRWFGGSK